jgi:hypothetical protein
MSPPGLCLDTFQGKSKAYPFSKQELRDTKLFLIHLFSLPHTSERRERIQAPGFWNFILGSWTLLSFKLLRETPTYEGKILSLEQY